MLTHQTHLVYYEHSLLFCRGCIVSYSLRQMKRFLQCTRKASAPPVFEFIVLAFAMTTITLVLGCNNLFTFPRGCKVKILCKCWNRTEGWTDPTSVPFLCTTISCSDVGHGSKTINFGGISVLLCVHAFVIILTV